VSHCFLFIHEQEDKDVSLVKLSRNFGYDLGLCISSSYMFKVRLQ